MAIFYLNIASVSRGSGRKVVAAAAYRAGERIRDDRNRATYNFSARTDVSYKEILLPSGIDTSQLGWARDRAQLWNAAERAEHRRNARVGREVQLGLPHELPAQQRHDLARAFARELSDRYQVAIDLTVHEPRPAGDPRNHHAHLLMTTRELTARGLGAKTGLDLGEGERGRRGLLSSVAEFTAVRQRWATLTNEALREAGLSARVDHRNLRAQGVDREPQPHIPYAVIMHQRRALNSEVGQRIAASHRARVQSRQATKPSATQPAHIEDVRQQAREAWLKMRQAALKGKVADKSLEQSVPDDDRAL